MRLCSFITRFIAFTGYGAPEDKPKACHPGIDLHLTKPVRVNLVKELTSVYGQDYIARVALVQVSRNHISD